MDQGQNRAAEDERAGQSAAGPAGDCFTFPFPPREFADRGTKWLLSDPAHLRHVVRVVAPELSEGLDFERLEPVLTEEIPQQLQQQVALAEATVAGPGSAGAGGADALCAGVRSAVPSGVSHGARGSAHGGECLWAGAAFDAGGHGTAC
jgi:hypothetical protein